MPRPRPENFDDMSSAAVSFFQHHHQHHLPPFDPVLAKWDPQHQAYLIANGLPSPRSLPASSPRPQQHHHHQHRYPSLLPTPPLASDLAIFARESHKPMPLTVKRVSARAAKGPVNNSSDAGDVEYHPRPGRSTRRASIKHGLLSPSDDDQSDAEGIVSRRKRKRSPSPSSSESDELESLSDAEMVGGEEREPAREAPPPPAAVDDGQVTIQLSINDLTVNVPRNHTGPVLVQLDASAAFKLASQRTLPASTSYSSSSKRQRTVPAVEACRALPSTPETTKRAGFLDLPAELRNEIYRLVFTAGGRFNFSCPKNFNRSTALLRTCRQVHEEGRTILYGENDFYFARRTSRYGSFWEDEWREVGFRSIRKFVKSIGPKNLSLIRFIGFQFDDATPCLNPESMTHDERRFVNDDYLMSILRHLGDHAALQRIDMNFHGRRRVESSDSRFLSYLRRIKADSVRFVPYPVGLPTAFAMESKQEEAVRVMLLKSMTRTQKLYA